MGVRIKTISNDIPGVNKLPDNNGHAHQANKPRSESGQANKILELEWEALGKKLHKQIDKAPGPELENMRRQLNEKDEKLKQAERKISELKKQLTSLQEKQRAHKQQSGGNHPVQKKPAARTTGSTPGYHSTGGHRS